MIDDECAVVGEIKIDRGNQSRPNATLFTNNKQNKQTNKEVCIRGLPFLFCFTSKHESLSESTPSQSELSQCMHTA
jgi:hypothetical protein